MRLIASRCALATSAILFLWAAGGCYEELDDEEPSSIEPAAEPSPAPPPSSIGNTPRPGLGGAKRAAQNTVQKIQQEQRKLEETMEEDNDG